MTLEQVRYFIAAAELGSFSAAAQELYVSHSSVSRGVSALEEELGLKLLQRKGRTLLLTEAGESVYREGKGLLHQERHIKEIAAGYQLRQSIHVTCIGAYIPQFYETMRAFQAAHPEIDVILEQVGQQLVSKKLLNGEADLVLNFDFLFPDGPDYESLCIDQGGFSALLPPHHPLADRKTLRTAELIDRKDMLGENPLLINASPIDATQPWDVQSIMLQVKTGGGFIVVPEHAVSEFGQGCVSVPLEDSPHTYCLLLGWQKKNISAPLQTAIAFFKDAFA